MRPGTDRLAPTSVELAWWRMRRALAAILLAAVVAGCGVRGSNHGSQTGGATTTAGVAGVPRAHPQAIEPVAGTQADAQPAAGADPVGDVNAHAPPLSQVRQQLKLELVYAPVNNDGYIDPLQYVNHWSRTDQGVDAGMPVGAPILAPGQVKILAIIPDWYAGQPLVYFELLDGRQAGQVQYVAEQITDIARPGSILSQGQADRPLRQAGHRHRIRLVDATRSHPGDGHQRLRGRAEDPGRPVHAPVAECARSQRGL